MPLFQPRSEQGDGILVGTPLVVNASRAARMRSIASVARIIVKRGAG
jgi:hypothetical protein